METGKGLTKMLLGEAGLSLTRRLGVCALFVTCLVSLATAVPSGYARGGDSGESESSQTGMDKATSDQEGATQAGADKDSTDKVSSDKESSTQEGESADKAGSDKKDEADSQANDTVPRQDDSEAAAALSNPSGASKSSMLQGKAEVTATKDSNLRAWQSSQLYRQGVAALNARNYRLAADCFKRAVPGFDQDGLEKFQAETEFAQAQALRFLGQVQEASKQYQAAIALFNEYDPLSPYLKAALDNLEKVDPKLRGMVQSQRARLQFLKSSKGIITVDRNIVLKGGLTSYSGKFLTEKETADFPLDYVHEVIHKAFVRMTCLETAELGSNYLKAETSWYTLLASGHTVALNATSDFMTPTIKVKINERYYNIDVQLPDLGANKRMVFLLTDGSHIIAIDPITEDMWTLKGEFDQEPPKFTWKKLSHVKPKKRVL